MNEYSRLKNAFLDVVGAPVRESKNEFESDNRPANLVCWVSRNVWLHPDDPYRPDVQFQAWHGIAWATSEPRRGAGLWCGLGMEHKPVIRRVICNITDESLAPVATALGGRFRISLGKAGMNSAHIDPVYVGYDADVAQYDVLLMHIRAILNHSGLPRPHLQIYTQIGEWGDADNSTSQLAARLRSAAAELQGLFDLFTGGQCNLHL